MEVLTLLIVAVSAVAYAAYQCKLRRREAAEYQAATRARSRLAQEVAHELKNPITAILCSAETLEIILASRLEEGEKRCLGYIREYGDMVLRLVSNYLDLSLTDSDFSHGKPETVNVSEAVEGVVGLLQTSALRKNVEMSVEANSDDIWTEIDSRHLRQILFNLVHNAIKFTPAGGTVCVSIGEETQRGIVSIAIRDTGPGMTSEEVEELFNHQRPQRSRRRSGEGTGLGLLLTKRLVEVAKGVISVNSSVGRGSTFSIELPRVVGLRKETSYRPLQDRPLNGMSVLVVDSNSGTCGAVSTLIESLGGMVDHVSIAIDAVDALSKRQYTAVVIDNTLDGMNGSELAQIIRSDLPNSAARIVVAGDESQVREPGAADRYVTKPLNGRAIVGSLLDS